MRLTEGQLRRIIRQEVRRVRGLNEGILDSGAFIAPEADDDLAPRAARALGVAPANLLATDEDTLADFGVAADFVKSGASRGNMTVGTFSGMPAVRFNDMGLNVYFVAAK